MVTVGLMVIAWFVLTIELTLTWTRVVGVYRLRSVGQLVTFIIGSFGCSVIFIE